MPKDQLGIKEFLSVPKDINSTGLMITYAGQNKEDEIKP
jgi:hypothetical protein